MGSEEKCAVIVIDMQKEYFKKGGFLEVPDGPEVKRKITGLVAAARGHGVPVIHVRHISARPLNATFQAGTDAVDFVEGLLPEDGEMVITKTRPSSFYLTNLETELERRGIDSVIVCGLMSFMCCDTTARDANARGYTVYFVKDATAAIALGDLSASTIHAATCAVQASGFSRVVTTDEMIAQISRT